MQRVGWEGGCLGYVSRLHTIAALIPRLAVKSAPAIIHQPACKESVMQTAWRRRRWPCGSSCKAPTTVCATSRRLCSAPVSPASVVPLAEDHHTTQLVRFATPQLLTHEGLAYAACPVCGVSLHMLDMQTHLTTVHKHLVSPPHAARICRDRIRLYHHVTGVPLRRAWTGQKDEGDGATLTAVLPTVTVDGYVCNWCVERHLVHPTRDAFLKHVLHDHPDVDLDEVESKIPLLPAPTQSTRRATRSTYSVADSATGGTWKSETGPTRRLPGVQIVRDDDSHCAALPPHPTGRSVTRRPTSTQMSMAFCNREAALSAMSQPTEHGDYIFRSHHFPCELCGRVFAHEVHLLQHLEHRHSGTTSQAAGEGAPAHNGTTGASPTACYVEVNPTTPLDQSIAASHVSIITTTTPAALMQHVTQKLPIQHAMKEAQDALATSSRTPHSSFFNCSYCHRSFSSQGALDDHTSSKHGTSCRDSSNTQRDGGNSVTFAGTLTTVTEKTKWWCHECERGFAKAKALYAHMVQKHRLPLQLYPCPACKRTFSDVYSLEDHLRMVHRSIAIEDLGITTHVSCPDCRRCFLNHEVLRLHAIKHHKRDPRLPARSLHDTTVAETCETRQLDGLNDAQDHNLVSAKRQVNKTPRKVARHRVRMTDDNTPTS